MILLLNALSRLPLWFLYILSDALAFTASRILRYRRKVVFLNLRNSFPDKSPKEIDAIAKGFYRNLADLIVETVKAISISREELVRRVQFQNLELVESYQKTGKPVIVVTIHQCNWEWVMQCGCIQFPVPVAVLYQPLKNKRMDRLMTRIRSRFGGTVIPSEAVLGEIRKRRDFVRAFGILADQNPSKKSKKFWSPFLNQETAFNLGPKQIAKLFDYPVIFLATKRVKRGRYQVDLLPVAEPPYSKEGLEIIEGYIRIAEEVVSLAPTDWLWSHRRWKYKRDAMS